MVYSRADGLFHMIEQSDFVDAKVIAGMVTTFVGMLIVQRRLTDIPDHSNDRIFSP